MGREKETPLNRTDATGRRLPVSFCPDCGAELDAASSITRHRPGPGDVSVCVQCTTFLQYDDTMHLKVLTAADLRQLPQGLQDMLYQARLAVQDIRR